MPTLWNLDSEEIPSWLLPTLESKLRKQNPNHTKIADSEGLYLFVKKSPATGKRESISVLIIDTMASERLSHSWVDWYSRTVIGGLELNVFPYLGNTPLKEITAPILLDVLEP